MAIDPTDEQSRIVELAQSGSDMSVNALAGTGKTSTLVLVAEALEGRGQYIAFNKAIVQEATSKFPPRVACNTAHSIAYRAVGTKYARRLNNTQRMTNASLAVWLGCRTVSIPTRYGNRQLDAAQVAGVAQRTLKLFCKSAAPEMTIAHLARVPLVSDTSEGQRELAATVLPLARRLWGDVIDVDGVLKFVPDYYMKLWQLGDPTINCDYILFDEAQDADGVMLTVVNAQDAQLVYCGDRYQAIYEWRGAINALDQVGIELRPDLTQSFRFGDDIAAEANDFLRRLAATATLRGLTSIASVLGPVKNPDAILCRTNGGVVRNVLDCLADGRKPAVVGGTKVLIDFADACASLIAGGRTGHPELAPFKSWDEVLQWVQDEREEAAQIATMVKLVSTHGVQPLTTALHRCVEESAADVTISTVHKAKGREWSTVRISNDFVHRDDMGTDELRLAYVAVTRARDQLDISEWSRVLRRADQPQNLTRTAPLRPQRVRPKRPPILMDASNF